MRYNPHQTGAKSDEHMIRQSVMPFKRGQEIGLAIAYEFKEGNDNSGKLDIVGTAFEKTPEGKRIDEVFYKSRYQSR